MKLPFLSAAIKVFRLDEGDGPKNKPGKPYRDSKGYWTIGRGHYIGPYLHDLTLPEPVIEALFQYDLSIAIRDARFVLGDETYDKLVPARQLAIVSLAFNMGRSKLSKFTETIDAIRKENWGRVADLLLKTKWARDVDPNHQPDMGRDDRIAYMFRTGLFHPDYKVNEL